MKKIVIFISLFICVILTSIRVSAATWKYEWSNTVVYVPVGAELDDYRDIPKASLYRDGIILPDANVTYSQEGDWLYFLRDIDTQVVGEYKVWYKAYENDKYSPGTCTGYKCLITFIVEDKIAPVIEVVSAELNLRRQTITTASEENEESTPTFDLEDKLLNNVNVYDNYSDCKITFEHNIDLTRVGRYEVKSIAVDTSNNLATTTFFVNVFEDRAPTITFNNTNNVLKVSINDTVNIKDYFNAYDYFDGDISSNIKYPSLNTSQLGSFSYTVSVTNSAGISTSYEITVEVVDDKAPELLLTTHTVILDYKEDFNSFNFNKYIKTIRDNIEINYDNLSIYHDLENKVGTYHIWYEYFDGIYTVEDVIDVKLVSYERPIVEVNDIIVDANTYVDIMNYILVIDDSDANVLQNVVIDDSDVNYSKEGTYYADVYVVNSSGLSTTKKIRIVINKDTKISNNDPIIVMSIILAISIIGCGGFLVYNLIKRKKEKRLKKSPNEL